MNYKTFICVNLSLALLTVIVNLFSALVYNIYIATLGHNQHVAVKHIVQQLDNVSC